MEVKERIQPRERTQPHSTSSFECESSVMDSWLGIRTIGDKHLRFDSVQEPAGPARKPATVFAPIEVIPARSISPLIDEACRRERLVRLLDQQQAWYDAAQEAAMAAERILSLREHHQQQWLQSPPTS